MVPANATMNEAYQSLVNAKFIGDALLGPVRSSKKFFDSRNFFKIKHSSVPKFLCLVLTVVSTGSLEPMLRIATLWAVASMENVKWIWIAAINNQPSKPRSPKMTFVYSYLSISTTLECSNPRPTFRFWAFLNLCPKFGLLFFSDYLERNWYCFHASSLA
jgi:hypothetical protein